MQPDDRSDSSASRRRAALRLSVVEGMAHAVMLGTVDSFMGAFAVELGHGDTNLALLATVPLVAGALSQLAAEPITARVGGRKRLVVVGAALQAASHLAFVMLAWAGSPLLLPLLLAKVAFWVTGSIVVPPWSAWIGDLTQGSDRARYFGLRSGAIQIALVVAFLAGGGVLGEASERGELLRAYTWLFLAGLGARLSSALLLALQHDPVPSRAAVVASAFRPPSARWRVALYAAALQLAAFVAIPFFTPYMLKDLGLSYQRFAFLTAMSIVAKAIVFPFCHRIAGRFGMGALLGASGAGLAVVPPLWIFTRSFEGLVGLEILAGACWAGWEYASFQLLLASALPGSRLAFFSWAGSLAALAQLGGSLVGAALCGLPGVGYHGVFAVSGCLRAAALLVLLPALPTLPTLPGPFKRLFTRAITVRPTTGAVQRPITVESDSGADEPER